MRITTSTLVLTHTGSAVPDYAEHCIKQAQFKNPRCSIILITDSKHGINFIHSKNISNVKLCPIQELENDVNLQNFRQVSWFKNWGRPNTFYPSPDNFVHGTSERLFLLNAFVCKYKINDFWHIENDNLIYGSLEWLSEHYLKKENKLKVCYMNEKHCVFNIVYSPKYWMLNEAVLWYLNELKQGNDVLINKYKIDMVQEMTVMRQYKELSYFPSLPTEKPLAGYLFDPASYGQYLGGTNNGHPPGFLDNVNHDIGRQKNTTWKECEFFQQQPYVEGIFKVRHNLFNLHVHNKYRMKQFSNYERKT